jgi:hypothetical protein
LAERAEPGLVEENRRMRSKTVLLLLCLAGLFARGATAAPIATIVEGESSFVRDASRVGLAEGVRLANDDLIDTTAQTKLLRIEFDDGLMLLVAPESRLWIAPKFGIDKTAPRAARLYLLHGTVKLTTKGDAPAASPIATPLFDLKASGRDTVVSVVGNGGAVFAESGDVQIVERTKIAKNGATTAGAALTVKTGEYYTRPGADKGKTAARPDAEFIKRLPRAFLDPVPSRAALFAAREVAGKPLGAIDYAAAQPWIDAEAALRPAFLTRWRPLAAQPEFRKGLISGLRGHPEWDRTLFPEKYLPKPASGATGVTGTPGS